MFPSLPIPARQTVLKLRISSHDGDRDVLLAEIDLLVSSGVIPSALTYFTDQTLCEQEKLHKSRLHT